MNENVDSPTKIGVRKIKKALTRKAIIDSTLAIVSKHGIDEASLRDIVKDASTTMGNFYNHFESKDHLFATVYLENTNMLTDFYSSLDKKRSVSERLLVFVDLIAKNITDPEMERFIFNKILLNDKLDFPLERDEVATRCFSLLFDEGLSNGEFITEFTANELTHYFISVYRGLSLSWTINSGNNELQKDFRDMTLFLLKSLKTK